MEKENNELFRQDMLEFMGKDTTFKDLVYFHSTYKYLIYAKSQIYYKKLGNLVANSDKKPYQEVLDEYKILFLQAVSQKTNIKNTYNVLLHIYGYFKKQVSFGEKKEILQKLNEFKSSEISLNEALKILEFYARKFNQTYILNQKLLKFYKKDEK